MFEDLDVDMNNLGIALVLVGIFAIIIIGDPLKMGWDKMNIFLRVILLLIMIPISYFIVNSKVNG